MNPAEFIRYAESILNRPAPIPAALRSVTSRAYYGAYHLTCALFEFKTDRKIIDMWLKACSHPDARKLGSLLGNLQTSRNLADYQLDQQSAESPNSARRAIELAREIEALLSVFQDKEVKALVLKEIDAHLAKSNQNR